MTSAHSRERRLLDAFAAAVAASAAVLALLTALLPGDAWAASTTTTAAAPAMSVYAVPGVRYPAQALRLTASSPLGTAAAKMTVNENGLPVNGLTVTVQGAASGGKPGTILLIDHSNSMSGAPLDSAVAAARAFVAAHSSAEPIGIMYLAQRPTIAVPLTTNKAALEQALAKVPATHSGTHIMDAASSAIAQLRAAGMTEGTLVILSDGQDTGSSTSEAQVANAAAAQHVGIYTIGMQDASFDGGTLQSLAAESGGSYLTTTPSGAAALFQQLGTQLSNQYVLHYTSQVPKGTLVNVAVSVPGFPTATTTYSTIGPTEAAPPSGFWTSTPAVLLLTLAIAGLVGAAVWGLLRKHNEVSARVGEYMLPVSAVDSDKRERSLVELALGDSQARALQRSPRWRAFATELDVGRIPIGPIQYVVLAIIGIPVVGLLAYAITGGKSWGWLVGFAAPAFAYWFAGYRADRQRRLFDSQLPDNLSVVASAMRAGQTFLGALQAVVDTAPEPSKSELRRAVTDAQLGVPIDEALETLGERLKSVDFQHVALVAQLQRETGGNTAEVIDLVADTIRDRLELRMMVRALTAQGRLAGMILSCLPLGLLLIISLLNATYERPLFHTTIGVILLIAGALMTIAGGYAIRKIVTIEM
jgi:tight adherence protein B